MVTLDQQLKSVKKLREDLKIEEARLCLLLKKDNNKKLGNIFKEQTPIEVLHLSERAYKALIYSNIFSLEKLQIMPVSELKLIKNLGIKGIREIVKKCKEYGVNLELIS